MQKLNRTAKKYDDFHLQRKLEKIEEIEEPWHQMIISVLKNIHLPSLTILDCACGRGPLLKYFSEEYPHIKVIGVDISDYALKEAQNYGEVVKASIYSLPFKDNSFDMVISAETLEHLEYPEKGLDELCRVCKTSLIITFPNYLNLRGLYLLYRKYIKRQPLTSAQPIEKRLTILHIIWWLKKRGFKLEKIEGKRVIEIFLPKHPPFNIQLFERGVLKQLFSPFALHLLIKANKI